MLNHFYRSSAEKELGKITQERRSAVFLVLPGEGGWVGRESDEQFLFFILRIIKLLAGHRALNLAPPS